MSVFVLRIKEMLQLRPEQVWPVHRAVTRDTWHVTPPLLSPVLIPHRSAVTAHPHTIHAPATSAGLQMAYKVISIQIGWWLISILLDTHIALLFAVKVALQQAIALWKGALSWRKPLCLSTDLSRNLSSTVFRVNLLSCTVSLDAMNADQNGFDLQFQNFCCLPSSGIWAFLLKTLAFCSSLVLEDSTQHT